MTGVQTCALPISAKLDTMASDVYRYLNFDQIAEFLKIAASANIPVIQA